MEAVSEILIVDDERVLRKQKRALLEGEGYRVRTAKNGDDALEAIYVRKPDLVLLDYQMPRKNGFVTCEAIRKTDPLLPVILLTAFDSEANELRARGLGADDFFSKSSSDALLLAAIRRALSRSKAAAAASRTPRRMMLGRVEIDFDALTARGDDIDERLTKTEADFLWLLNSERGRCFSYDDIFEVLRGSGYAGTDSALYVHVSNLKKKLGVAGLLIRNERGLGYQLT